MFLALELCLTSIFLALAFFRPELGNRLFAYLEKRLSAFAAKSILVVVSIGLLSVALRLALLAIVPIPVPETHDEFSYLLQADTFAHGRLSNPTHPMWEHFETFHVNWHPTYASMYYPGQGIFLAFGQKFFGHPFWGVTLSCALMCAAICWALQGWMPASWAFLGGLLAIIRLGTFSYWANSYWGGAVAALGGALVLGALPRIKNSQRLRDAVILAIGMALLANTRPYEGLFLCIPVLFSLVLWLVGQKRMPVKRSIFRVVLPAASVVAIAFAVMGFYFRKLTGSPFTTPYQLNMRTYGLVYFPWQKIHAVPEFHHAVMQQLYRGGAVVGMYNYAHEHPFQLHFSKELIVWLFYFGPVLSIPWLVWLFTRRAEDSKKSVTPEFCFLLFLYVANAIALGLTIYVGQPHYSAPFTAAFYIGTLLVMRDLSTWKSQGHPSGRAIVRSVVLVCMALFLLRAAVPVLHISTPPTWIRTWCSQDPQNLARAQTLKELERRPGQHLVIVQYKPDHDFILDEWVFNNADIDGSKVIWARDMGAENAELIHYFGSRQVWLAQPDYNPPKLSRYVE